MAVSYFSGKDVMDVIKQMKPAEFDAFFEEALLSRVPPKATTLSPMETTLIAKINRGLPVGLCRRHDQLAERRTKSRPKTQNGRRHCRSWRNCVACRFVC